MQGSIFEQSPISAYYPKSKEPLPVLTLWLLLCSPYYSAFTVPQIITNHQQAHRGVAFVSTMHRSVVLGLALGLSIIAVLRPNALLVLLKTVLRSPIYLFLSAVFAIVRSHPPIHIPRIIIITRKLDRNHRMENDSPRLPTISSNTLMILTNTILKHLYLVHGSLNWATFGSLVKLPLEIVQERYTSYTRSTVRFFFWSSSFFLPLSDLLALSFRPSWSCHRVVNSFTDGWSFLFVKPASLFFIPLWKNDDSLLISWLHLHRCNSFIHCGIIACATTHRTL